MLRSLHIENIAVVKRADIDFEGGFFNFKLSAHARQIKPIGTLN